MIKHGMRKHPIYNSWRGMKDRCQNQKNRKYPDYGGRGIKICERWQEAANFIEDMMPTWKPGLSIERIDNNGNYEPSNCKWATCKEQNTNQRTWGKIPFKGVSYNGNKYKAQITINGKLTYLGTFDTPELAHEAYLEARQ